MYRLLPRSRGSQFGTARRPAGKSDVAGVAFDDVWRLLRSYVEALPEAVVRAMCSRLSLSDLSGPAVLEPRGVSSGMALAAIPRASYGARLQRPRSLNWNCVSRMLSGLSPNEHAE